MNRLSKLLLLMGIILLSLSILLYFYFQLEEICSGKMVKDTMNNLINDDSEVIHNDNFDIKVIDNEEYIGYLEIPSLNLLLPITNGYSYNSLRKSPALYYGNLNSNLVICGHSYKAHFGNLYKLKQGDIVIFRDINNNRYVYEVEEVEILKPTEIKEMIESNFDLTLYTCTKDSKSRVTIRCNRIG